jgi:hypothetical protein
MTEQPSIVDRLLAHFQTRWPQEFEICLLSAQLDEASEKISALEAKENGAGEQLLLPV